VITATHSDASSSSIIAFDIQLIKKLVERAVSASEDDDDVPSIETLQFNAAHSFLS
jgi:hypothetical protein